MGLLWFLHSVSNTVIISFELANNLLSLIASKLWTYARIYAGVGRYGVAINRRNNFDTVLLLCNKSQSDASGMHSFQPAQQNARLLQLYKLKRIHLFEKRWPWILEKCGCLRLKVSWLNTRLLEANCRCISLYLNTLSTQHFKKCSAPVFLIKKVNPLNPPGFSNFSWLFWSFKSDVIEVKG